MIIRSRLSIVMMVIIIIIHASLCPGCVWRPAVLLWPQSVLGGGCHVLCCLTPVTSSGLGGELYSERERETERERREF